jgi:glycine/D-amino acid oxidase-like deaminating enzyme
MCRPSAQGVFQGASGFAVLAAGLWAGFLWGADGRLPLLISGIAGGVFAVALIAITLRRRPIPFSVRMTCCR